MCVALQLIEIRNGRLSCLSSDEDQGVVMSFMDGRGSWEPWTRQATSLALNAQDDGNVGW